MAPAAPALTSGLVLVLGLLGLVLYGLFCLKRPKLATAAALAAFAVVPFWLGASVSVFFVSAHLVLMGLAGLGILANRLANLRQQPADLILAGIFILTLAAMVTNLTTLHQLYTFLQWMLAYAFARLAASAFGVRWVATVMAIAFPVVALAMVFEFFTGINVWQTYLAMNNSAFSPWAGLQSRGGVLRAEGPFGHSIAAGSILAVVAILTIDAKLPPWRRFAVIGILALGILVTISRIGLITVAFGIFLAVVFARISLPRGAKAALLAALLGGVVVVTGVLGDVFAESGSEAANSAAYRLWLLDLLPMLNPLGYADGFSRSSSGSTSFGAYGSVDSAVLFFALTNGWIPALLLLLLLASIGVQLVRRRGGAATAAVVAQVPALFTVALITSFGLVFWLSVGLAVAEAGRPLPSPHEPEIDSSAPVSATAR